MTPQPADPGFFVWGMGQMGSGVARELIRRGWHPTGAVSHQVGEDIGGVLGLDRIGLGVTAEPPSDLADSTQLCVIATNSHVEQCLPQILWAVEHGLDVICSAEQLAYPWESEPELSAQIDRAARRNDVSVLGTGINPGFIMDVLPICLSAASNGVERLEIRRVNDLSPFGQSVHDSFGVGLTPAEFEAAEKRDEIAGHVGFPESIAMISAALGLAIDSVVESKTPIISTVARRLRDRVLPAGVVVGCRQVARAYADGELRIVMDHPQQVDPAAEATETGDFIELFGSPNISMRSSPEIPGGTGTIAVMANCAAQLRTARAGLLTMIDLALPRFARAGDFSGSMR
ncbi:hypothetical protein M2272_004420 [Mycobacterium frederiksbergense]|uniref:2,4-diaminopentanoate dehydrogenase C-terminal domain-containing protein n=1 Tax=Mycolicibacterium frederiksbergense TaxID=117567 RepID=A0ABT6L4A9_9MYCO|nr:hypothetical protein [Mycolicibacterium frederiksbergense]MDH6197764.1 hypothetical protein [Mycolicibacterium frederiksbergense]